MRLQKEKRKSKKKTSEQQQQQLPTSRATILHSQFFSASKISYDPSIHEEAIQKCKSVECVGEGGFFNRLYTN